MSPTHGRLPFAGIRPDATGSSLRDDPYHRTLTPPRRGWSKSKSKGGDSMTYERPAVLATYKVEELMTDAAVCTQYFPQNPESPA